MKKINENTMQDLNGGGFWGDLGDALLSGACYTGGTIVALIGAGQVNWDTWYNGC